MPYLILDNKTNKPIAHYAPGEPHDRTPKVYPTEADAKREADPMVDLQGRALVRVVPA